MADTHTGTHTGRPIGFRRGKPIWTEPTPTTATAQPKPAPTLPKGQCCWPIRIFTFRQERLVEATRQHTGLHCRGNIDTIDVEEYLRDVRS